MSDKLKWYSLWIAVAFFVVSMSGMLVYAEGRKEAVVKEQESEPTDFEKEKAENMGEEGVLPLPLAFEEKSEVGNRLCIVLPDGTAEEDVIVENRYMEEELWVTFLGEKAVFYDTQPLYGNTAGILSGIYQKTEDCIRMRIQLDDVYECRSMVEEGKLYLTLEKPGSVYEKIVVIDPVYSEFTTKEGGMQEKDITLDIALRLKEKLDGSPIKAYFTRLEDEKPEEKRRMKLAEAAEADFVISIGTSQKAEDTAKYGTEIVYNSDFFTPFLSSAELADKVLRQVVTRINGRADGLVKAASQEQIVWEAPCPAVLLRVGYLTNEQEAALLAREDYREKIAEGIYQAILQVYDEE